MDAMASAEWQALNKNNDAEDEVRSKCKQGTNQRS